MILVPPADALVHALKYEGWRGVAPLMAERMSQLAVLPNGILECVVVPVPTTRSRRRRRGYNQAGLLARSLGHNSGWPVIEALEREGGGRTQVSLRPIERRANVRRAFSLREPTVGRLEGKYVVLVDDVLTTGATASAASEVLERAGVVGVSLVAFARAVPRLPVDAPGRRSASRRPTSTVRTAPPR